MKRLIIMMFCLYGLSLLSISSSVGGVRGDMLYVNLFFHIEAHPHAERSALMTERLAKLFVKHNASADFWFTGLIADYYQNQFPEVVRYLREHRFPLGYHGDIHHPHPNPLELINDLTWDEAIKKSLFWETHRLDGRTAQLDPETPGGWTLMEEVFGQVPVITVPGGGPGIATTAAVHKILGAQISMLITNEFSRETTLYRWMGMLGWSHEFLPQDIRIYCEKENIPVKKPMPQQDPEGVNILTYLADRIALRRNVDLNHVSIIAVAKHDFNFFSRPGGGWQGPYRTDTELDEAFQEYENLIVALQRHPNIQLVTSEDIIAMTAPQKTSFSKDDVNSIAKYLLEHWNGCPPDFIKVGDSYCSLNDAFLMLNHTAAYYKIHRVLPDSYTVRDIWGPTELIKARTGTVSVSGEKLLSTALETKVEITDRIPARIFIKDTDIPCNSAEYLLSLAKLHRKLEELSHTDRIPGEKTEVEVDASRFRQFTLGTASDNVRDLYCLQLWTYEPIRLRK